MNKLVITHDFLNNLHKEQKDSRYLRSKARKERLKKTLKNEKKKLKYLTRNNIDLSSNLSRPIIPKISDYLKHKEKFFNKKKKNFETIFENSLNLYLKKFQKHKNIPKYTKMSNYNLLKILKAFPESENKIIKMAEEPFLKTVSKKKQILNVLCKYKNEKKKIEIVSKNVKKKYMKNLEKRMNSLDNKNYNFNNIKKDFQSNQNNLFTLNKVYKNNFSKKSFSLSNFKGLKKSNTRIDFISRRVNVFLDKKPKIYKNFKSKKTIRPSQIHLYRNES